MPGRSKFILVMAGGEPDLSASRFFYGLMFGPFYRETNWIWRGAVCN
jgi:hypothetical protein